MKSAATIPLLMLGLSMAGAATLEVGEGRSHAGIKAALRAATDGDVIRVFGGTYREGAILIDKSVTLDGVNTPVLDGEFKHPVLTVKASKVTVSGFKIVNGGRSSTQEIAGIHLDHVKDFTVQGNQLTDCDYGIYLSKCGPGDILENTLKGLTDLEINSGNGIHLWSSEGVRVRGNRIVGHRDGIYLEHSGGARMEENRVEDNMRYGLHFMFSSNSLYRANVFHSNGAGVAVMYSQSVMMHDNIFEQNWGSSSYGLLIKDVTDSEVSGNVFLRNSTGIYAQGASRMKFERNQFRENGWALRLLSNGSSNSFTANTFSRNSFDVGTNADLSEHRFSRNYWDRYEGYDLKHDGLGDVPFRPVSLFAIITERVPASLFLMHSFMVKLLDRAEKAFPTITPDSVIDSEPVMRPYSPQPATTNPANQPKT